MRADGAPRAEDTETSGLVISSVSKSFADRSGLRAALVDVSLTVPRGRFVTLIGPSGCGKSTLLRVVGGIERADHGEVSIFGESVDRARENKHIGFVPQSLALLPWRTVLENVRLPLEIGRRTAARADRTSLRDPVEILTAFGLGDVLHLRPAELSGGMRQRVAIARAFAFEPAVLLMDEPFSALDELTSELLRHQLLELWQANQTTVLFVTHSVTEAVLLSDLVVVMTGAPGSVHSVVPIDLPRPRNDLVELTDQFHSYETRLRVELRQGMAISSSRRD